MQVVFLFRMFKNIPNLNIQYFEHNFKHVTSGISKIQVEFLFRMLNSELY